MKTFQFSLQQVLDLRIHQRKQAEKTLAAARRQRKTVEAKARRMLSTLEEMLQKPHPSTANPALFRRRVAHREATRQTYREMRETAEQLRENEREVREQLVETRRAEESLQSLYDKEKRAHHKRQSQAEERMLDEQAIAQYMRKNNSIQL